MSASIWWHMHSAFPYRCYGGSPDRDDAAELLEIVADANGSSDLRLIESKDHPDRCTYQQHGRVIMRGEVVPSDTPLTGATV